uniref:Shikimate dehydrogenase (NADP(+)) n=1 Tax=Chlorobium chlorochromatii (strain CaD3) TaxID=340177 RepID=AROE_CHLCH|nr:RecName: Full=Shikimate dehydrogenase (NADP(+)); Short=SDH [Chlorobium chlorochromatii CaD3]
MNSSTRIFALLGRAVDYSYSPLIHNTAFQALGLPYHYTIFNIAEAALVGDALRGARALGLGGFSVTIPYKQTVVPFLDELSEEATTIQAVNCIVNKNGKLIGYNTDILGFASPLFAYREALHGATIALFGSGGAALAAIEAFQRYFTPKQVLLFARDSQKAKSQLRSSLALERYTNLAIVPLSDYERVRECRLVINATPLGTKGRADGSAIIPLESNLLHSEHIVYDMVYNPTITPLLQAAQAVGASTIFGIEMLIGQAEQAFTLWTGEKMPTELVRQTVMAKLQEL